MTDKKSFFRRDGDQQAVENPSRSSVSGSDDSDFGEPIEPKAEKQYVTRRPLAEGKPPRARAEREGGEGRGGREQSPNRAVRGQRTDFRKTENRAPKEQREAPENVIFGTRPVLEALEAERPIEKIYLRRVQRDDKGSDIVEQIEQKAAQEGITVQWVPMEKLDRLSRRNNHQGVVAVVPAVEYAQLEDVLERKPTLLLVLDGITDVRNFGAIARSAECSGVDAIVVGAKNCAPINGEAIKSSAGALSRIAVCRVGSLRNTLKTIQMSGIQLVAATEKSESNLYQCDFTPPTAIIMGDEQRGISSDTLKLCDQKASIPLLGQIESLNVSAAAAVLLFEAIRQRLK